MDVVQDDLPICTYLYPYDSLRGMDMCGRDVVRSESHSFSSSRRKHLCRSRRSQRARGLRGSVSQFVDLWVKFCWSFDLVWPSFLRFGWDRDGLGWVLEPRPLRGSSLAKPSKPVSYPLLIISAPGKCCWMKFVTICSCLMLFDSFPKATRLHRLLAWLRGHLHLPQLHNLHMLQQFAAKFEWRTKFGRIVLSPCHFTDENSWSLMIDNFLQDNTDPWFRKAQSLCCRSIWISLTSLAATNCRVSLHEIQECKDWFQTNLKGVEVVDVSVWLLGIPLAQSWKCRKCPVFLIPHFAEKIDPKWQWQRGTCS